MYFHINVHALWGATKHENHPHRSLPRRGAGTIGKGTEKDEKRLSIPYLFKNLYLGVGIVS